MTLMVNCTLGFDTRHLPVASLIPKCGLLSNLMCMFPMFEMHHKHFGFTVQFPLRVAQHCMIVWLSVLKLNIHYSSWCNYIILPGLAAHI